MSIVRFVFIFFLSAPIIACASTLSIPADRALLDDEFSRQLPVKKIPARVILNIDAPVVALGKKPGQIGDPSYDLKYPANEMLTHATEVAVARWFSGKSNIQDSVHIDVRLHSLLWDEHTDVFMWRPVIQVDIELNVEKNSRQLLHGVFSSGKQKGVWHKIYFGPISSEHPSQYGRIIYKAMFIALEKGMTELTNKLKEE